MAQSYGDRHYNSTLTNCSRKQLLFSKNLNEKAHFTPTKPAENIRPSIPSDIDTPPFYLPLKSMLDHYRVISELGSGSFGSVTLCKSIADVNNFCGYQNTMTDQQSLKHYREENYFNRRSGLVAIKTMMTRMPQLNDYTRVREIKFILQMPAHKQLATIHELFIDDVNFQLHIVMECMDQNLYQLMKARKKTMFSSATLRSILAQILSGIRHIHRHSFFHRDIKPENILISPSHSYYTQDYMQQQGLKDNYVVKIADYGLARHVTNKNPYTAYVSTRWYRSPEILLRKKFYSTPVDIWAFGCVAVEVATFRPLFPGSDEVDQTWKVFEVLGTPFVTTERQKLGRTVIPPPGGYWSEAKELLSQMKSLQLSHLHKEGYDISCFITDPCLKELCQVVRACLVWDPEKRSSAEELCVMSYFRNSIVNRSLIRTPHHPTVVYQHGNNENATPKIHNSKSSLPCHLPNLLENMAHPPGLENTLGVPAPASTPTDSEGEVQPLSSEVRLDIIHLNEDPFPVAPILDVVNNESSDCMLDFYNVCSPQHPILASFFPPNEAQKFTPANFGHVVPMPKKETKPGAAPEPTGKASG